MSAGLVGLYQRLPAPMRAVAAAARGYYLRAWRYGRETDALVDQALARERWSPDEWEAWRARRLAMVLQRAATRVPYYREAWAERRRRGDARSWEALTQWPVLEKETLRRMPRAFLADDCRPRAMFRERTSGTTGTSLDLWWSRSTVRAWYALFEARWRRWYGLSRHDRWAILGGQLVVPVARRDPPFWVWNPALHQLYLSSHHLAPHLVVHYVDALRRHRVRYLFGYTSSIHMLAMYAPPGTLRSLGLAVVITNAEPVLPHQRAAIEQAFGCPVRETYGMGEIVTAASECEAGRLHLWPEVGVVEVLADGAPAGPGEAGDLVCTGLLNVDMPLVRYRVGDRAALDPDAAPCPCGRTLPRLERIEGRSNDLLIAPDGRRVYWVNPVFYGLPIREAQVVQRSLTHVVVRYVPAPEFTPATERTIASRLEARLGGITVTFEPMDRIPREPNGKFRAVRCEVPVEEIATLEAARSGTP
jgi:phenylacetate-CoA ligase